MILKRTFAVVLAVLLIGCGLFFNPYVYVRLMVPQGVLPKQLNRIIVETLFFDAFFVVTGTALILYGYREKRPIRVLSNILVAISGFMALWLTGEAATAWLKRGVPRTYDPYRYTFTLADGQRTSLWRHDESLGATLKPDLHVLASRMSANQNVLFNAIYTIDHAGHRITPVQNREKRNRFLLFFVDSVCFGDGANDNETIPYYVGTFCSKYTPYNYGAPGYGLQHMLIELQSGELRKEIREKEGKLIYLYHYKHVAWLIGSMSIHNTNGDNMPYLRQDRNGKIVRYGNLITGRPFLSVVYPALDASNIVHFFFGDLPWVTSNHLKWYIRVLEECRNEFRKQFKSDEFYVVNYPGEVKEYGVIPLFQQAGIKYLDYRRMFDPESTEFTRPHDLHPSPPGYEKIAKQLVRDLHLE